MRIRVLGARPAPASLRDFRSRWVGGQSPSIPVQRRQIPYWHERGWTRQGNTYSGNYQTPYGAFQGWIEQQRSGHIDFYLYHPSPEIQSHSHWTCFQHRGTDWSLGALGRHPKEVGAGILHVSRLIKEAFEQQATLYSCWTGTK